MNQIKKTDKVCYNCKYLAWLISVGQGLKCGHPSKREEGKKPPSVPGRQYTCELFENRTNQTNK